MTHLHLVDGTYELFRAHFGVPSRLDPNGREVGATVGIFQSIARLLREPEVTHVAVAFDRVVESFRNDMFDGYKTGEGMEPVLFAQFDLAERAIAALGVKVWPMIEFEADDALATGAAYFAEKVDKVFVMTPDKDLAQCVLGRHVVMVDRRRELEIDEAGVHAKWGIAPESIPDYLALVGDTADGIPGLKGWGAKSASTVLAQYLHLEEIPASAADWDVKVRSGAKLGETLQSQMDDALLYRQLATLRTDAPIDTELEALRWKGADRSAVEKLAKELGVPRLGERVPRYA
jgi:5'-3' exonuclease